MHPLLGVHLSVLVRKLGSAFAQYIFRYFLGTVRSYRGDRFAAVDDVPFVLVLKEFCPRCSSYRVQAGSRGGGLQQLGRRLSHALPPSP